MMFDNMEARDSRPASQLPYLIPKSYEYFKDFPETSGRVADLSYFCRESDLYDFFSAVGRVMALFVCKGKDVAEYKPMYYGFFRMETVEQAHDAVRLLNHNKSSSFGQLHIKFDTLSSVSVCL